MKLKIGITIIIVWLICFMLFKKEDSSDIAAYNTKANSVSQYQLIWPGVLPDNKLYKIKILRDKVMTFFIISPTKKIEFNLLLADKTLYASKLLMDKGEIKEAQSAAAKGENYMSQIANDYTLASENHTYIPSDVTHRFLLASLKHQQLLEEMLKKVGPQDKKLFMDVKYFSKFNYDMIKHLNDSTKK